MGEGCKGQPGSWQVGATLWHAAVVVDLRLYSHRECDIGKENQFGIPSLLIHLMLNCFLKVFHAKEWSRNRIWDTGINLKEREKKCIFSKHKIPSMTSSSRLNQKPFLPFCPSLISHYHYDELLILHTPKTTWRRRADKWPYDFCNYHAKGKNLASLKGEFTFFLFANWMSPN